jgi:transposase
MELKKRGGRYTYKSRKAIAESYEKYGTLTRAAEKMGVHRATVKRAAEWAGIPVKSRGEANRYRKRKDRLRSDEIKVRNRIARLYESGMSSPRVAEVTGRCEATVQRVLRRRGLMRSHSEAARVRAAENGKKERVLKVCRRRVETDETWEEIADHFGISTRTCWAYWSDPWNPYPNLKGRALTDVEVREIRDAYAQENGPTQKRLAQKYDVGVQTIWNVIHQRGAYQ